MKKKALSAGFIVVLLFSVVSVSFAQVTPVLDGVYEEVGAPGSITVYAQDGNKVFVTGYYAISGQPRVWYGNGQRDGNVISYTYVITLGPSRLAAEKKATGRHILTISSDGRTMTGEGMATDGTSAPFSMKKTSN